MFRHNDGNAMGILCDPLCNRQGVHSLVCETLHAGKEAVFSAHWQNTRLVFKAARTETTVEQAESLLWEDANGLKHYPSETDFANMIRDVVTNKLNYSITTHQLERLSRLRTSRIETEPQKRKLEMENVWPLLQEQEYIMTLLFEDKDVFPQIIGTCGTFYAVEYVRPIETPTTVLALSDSKPEWAKRLKLAVMILDLLQEFETVFTEPFHLCDVKINHFGLPLGGHKLKFLDLDAVFPKSVLNRIMNNNRECERNEDCDYFDCRSLCSKNMRCESPVVNNNLQIICEKIFLGWTLSGTIIIPGLLMSEHTSSSLAVLLRQCANPTGEHGQLARAAAPENLKSRLYNMINEVERELSSSLRL
ncbi:divergent protein kinase domain 1C isoform X2 [Belonocnema kinseyi]|uniref:divergent protein kinase domain 1C isoform X2 n=1 Tax=Belonocnema kinseyi TaxID=2817044 RepID=UPI00143D81EA|nr:divergent protein kinase domain 1C isoform X2 [Belonocnema kinseyi]